MRNAVSEDAPAREKSGLAGWRVSLHASDGQLRARLDAEILSRRVARLCFAASRAPCLQFAGGKLSRQQSQRTVRTGSRTEHLTAVYI